MEGVAMWLLLWLPLAHPSSSLVCGALSCQHPVYCDGEEATSMSARKEEDAHDDLSHVADWLFVGGQITDSEHMARLAARGVTTVINAACEVSDRTLCEQH